MLRPAAGSLRILADAPLRSSPMVSTLMKSDEESAALRNASTPGSAFFFRVSLRTLVSSRYAGAALTLDLEIVHFRPAEQVLFEAGFVSRQRAKLVDREHDRALGSMTRNDLRAILLRLFNHFA